MIESASRREQSRRDTECRIMRCAQELTLERGLDGFTMDELADAAEVSRRTLFNYFPGKVDAVLGAGPRVFEGETRLVAIATFEAGGPSGDLAADFGELGRAILSDERFDPDAVRLRRQVLISDHRLIATVHERFEGIADRMVGLILAREGKQFGEDRAHLAVRLLIAVFDNSMRSHLAERDERPLADLFVENLSAARELLG